MLSLLRVQFVFGCRSGGLLMMNRHYLKVPVYVGFFSLPLGKHDKPSFEGSITAEEYSKVNPLNKSGMEGVKRVWAYDEYGSFSKELETSIHFAVYCGFLGGLWGGLKGGKEGYNRFMQHNMATKYVSELDAKKYLVDNMALKTFGGFFKLGAKVGLFTFAYMATASSVAVYRGKSGILDFVIGGAMAGGFHQFWNGPRALLIGVSTGSALGLFAGSFTYLTMRAAGKTFEDIQDWQYEYIKSREKMMAGGRAPDWQTEGENAMIFARKYDKEKELFKEEPPS